MAGVAACPAQRLQTGSGLWLFTWQCQEAAGADTTHSESDNHHLARSTQTGVQVSQVPITHAHPGLYPACMVIRIEHTKL